MSIKRLQLIKGMPESLFTCSFGLNKSKCDGSDTCDLIALLEDRLASKEVKQKLSELLSEQKRMV